MRKILVVVDMQYDFINGALGTPEAEAIVDKVVDKIKSYPKENVYGTMDTHHEHYLDTQEGKNLPVPHCIFGTVGWDLPAKIDNLINKDHFFTKNCFGSAALVLEMMDLSIEESIKIELVGLCTDICVISNALMLTFLLIIYPNNFNNAELLLASLLIS